MTSNTMSANELPIDAAVATPDIYETFEQQIEAEAKRSQDLEKSTLRAWHTAYGAIAVAVLLAVALMGLTPLKTVEAFVVRVDNVSGVTEVITSSDEKSFKSTEAQDIYWVNKYLMARESYDWFTIQDNYDLIGLLSAKHVADEYQALFTGKEALHKRLGSNTSIEIKIISINPRVEDGSAVCRFAKYEIPKGYDKTKVIPVYYTATIIYTYNFTSKMSIEDRRINPFGYQVTSYRADPEAVQKHVSE